MGHHYITRDSRVDSILCLPPTTEKNGVGCPKSKTSLALALAPALRGSVWGRAPPPLNFSRNGGLGDFCPRLKMRQILGHFCTNEGFFFRIFAHYARKSVYVVTLVHGVNARRNATKGVKTHISVVIPANPTRNRKNVREGGVRWMPNC